MASPQPPGKKKRPRPAGAPRPKPVPRTSDRRFVAVVGGAGLLAVLAFAGAWWATRLEVPYTAEPYPMVEPRRPASGPNALNAIWRANYDAKLTRAQRDVVPRWAWSRWEQAPPASMVALRRTAVPRMLAGLAEARKRPAMQVENPGKNSNLTGASTVLYLALFETRMRLAEQAEGDALRPAIDALHAARRLMYAEGHAPSKVFPGLAATSNICDVLLDPGTGALRRPTPELAAALRDLNAIAGLERPLGELVAAERDETRRSWTDPARGSEAGKEPSFFDQAYTLTVGAAVAEDAAAFYDAAGAAFDARRIQDGLAILASADAGMTSVQALFHPYHALVRYIVANGALDMLGVPFGVLDAEARFEALRVAIAAELHRRAHGLPPARLADLVPAYLPALPADPYRTGAPLEWSGGRLWSVGWDGRAQGGRSIGRKKGRRGTAYWAPGDLVLLPPESFPIQPWGGKR